ncbi:hypothetical protein AB0D12_31760 [Streptomyces sp. NPDC048479]|uniref:hypothetical protein n=1 Tax=Streptomyces sp. NPDC048479 TaxID=3154725 RepID=UPI003446D46A
MNAPTTVTTQTAQPTNSIDQRIENLDTHDRTELLRRGWLLTQDAEAAHRREHYPQAAAHAALAAAYFALANTIPTTPNA